MRGRIGAEHLRHHRTADEARRHIRNAYLDFAQILVGSRLDQPSAPILSRDLSDAASQLGQMGSPAISHPVIHNGPRTVGRDIVSRRGRVEVHRCGPSPDMR